MVCTCHQVIATHQTDQFVFTAATAHQYFLLILTIILAANVAQSIGMVISCSITDMNVSLAVAPLVFMPLMLFGKLFFTLHSHTNPSPTQKNCFTGGYYINLDNVPVYFLWIKYISPFKYGYEVLVVNEFTGKTLVCDTGPECPHPSGDQVIEYMSMTDVVVWENEMILLALIIGFKFIAYLMLRIRASQKE